MTQQPFPDRSFERADESPDTQFYEQPRLVNHIDDYAIAAVGEAYLLGGEGVVRRNGMVFVNGELWRAHTDDGSPLVPGERVRVERVEPGLQLVVGSTEPSTEKEHTA